MGGLGTLPREPFLTSSKSGDPLLPPHPFEVSPSSPQSLAESLPLLETSQRGFISALNVWAICPLCLISNPIPHSEVA